MPTRPRPPAVAGQFYEGDGAALARQVEGCFESGRGPGHLPDRHRGADRSIEAIVVPHAGLVYSGPLAALAYAAVAKERPPASVLVLGVDHHGLGGPASVSARDWETPLGRVPVDTELVEALASAPVEVDESAHVAEHSIEVQLPFLQYVLPKPRLAALMVRFGPLEFLEEVAAVVRRALVGRDVLVVASTDFSHYVGVETARRLDRLAIDQILERSARGLYGAVTGHDISMCGIAPTTVLLAALEDRPLDAALLRWGHSGEAEPMSRVVGYASLLLTRRGPAPASEPK